MSQVEANISKTIFKLTGLAIGMFAFAMWVMPPLYTLFCEVTGLNGKTGGKYEAVSAEIDTSRTVKVQFIGTNSANMSWGFEPESFSMDVHPGQSTVTFFKASNPSQNIMVGQAVPSVAPSSASSYFLKTECFCFNQQVLGPNEEANLGLQFIVDQALPKAVKTITLSYTLFDVTDMSPDLVNAKEKELAHDDVSALNNDLTATTL